MKVELLESYDINKKEEILKLLAAAGKISRFKGDINEAIDSFTDYNKALKYIERIVGMGHESISEHDYILLGITGVSPFVELTLIQERIASFTIKSRREVDFSRVSYFKPDFKGDMKVSKKYDEFTKDCIDTYTKFVENGIPLEDSRFALPYSFSNVIFMGMDARVLKDLVVRFTKGYESRYEELRQLGEKLYDILEVRAPYFVKSILEASDEKDNVVDLIGDVSGSNERIDVNLLDCTNNIDDTIFINMLIYYYNLSYNEAFKYYQDNIKNNSSLKDKLIMEMYKNNQKPFTQVNFTFEIPFSLATLPQLVRHRMQRIVIPDFKVWDHFYYKTPDSITGKNKEMYDELFLKSKEVYDYFKSKKIKDEDLIYLHVNGNMVNITTSLDGKSLAWIMHLRMCNKAQWEIRDIASKMVDLVKDKSLYFSSVLGADCDILGICREKKESCGKIKVIKRSKGYE